MFLVAAEHNQKGIPAYPSTSNVFANDVHRTSSPILNRPLAIPVRNSTAPFSEHINRNSIVLKMTYGGVSFLFRGDANADAENRIANSGANLQADILKVGHHGSATSSRSVVLSKVHPKSRIIEVGAGNPYGHMTPATLMSSGPGGIGCVSGRPEWRCIRRFLSDPTI